MLSVGSSTTRASCNCTTLYNEESFILLGVLRETSEIVEQGSRYCGQNFDSIHIIRGACGSVVVKALVGQSRDQFPVVSLDFSVTYSFRPYHGPGIDSAPSENEYQEHSWG